MRASAPDPFRIEYFEEPDILFADGKPATSPKRGLFQHGPRLKGDPDSVVINLGIIGDRDSIDRFRMFLSDIEFAIVPETSGLERFEQETSDHTRDGDEESTGFELDEFVDDRSGSPNRENEDEDPIPTPSHIPFPGLEENDSLNFSINADRTWQLVFDDRRIERVLDKSTRKDRIRQFLRLIENKIKTLAQLGHGPDVAVVCVPEIIRDKCTPPGEDHAKISEEGLDLHDQIKILGMKHEKLPTQVINNKTLYHDDDASKAKKAYNITAGLLYKAQDGHPWKTLEMDEGDCYAGIVFYERQKGDKGTHAALSHVFTKRGHNILQSGPLEELEFDDNRQPHLSRQEARRITEQVVDFYQELNDGVSPRRLVLHKSSRYFKDEREGFREGSADVGVRDFVTISPNTNIRLFPTGDYPAMRGTLLSVPSDERYYLYTVGYVPEMATWEGTDVPGPIRIEPDPEVQHTRGSELAKEILFLTKLDWNTTEFAVKMPITIKAASKVASVLSEVEEDDFDNLSYKYLFYM